jgi:hypothetical protein
VQSDALCTHVVELTIRSGKRCRGKAKDEILVMMTLMKTVTLSEYGPKTAR